MPAEVGLPLTFSVLSMTPNEAAVGALLSALDSPFPEVQGGAIRTLLDRHDAKAQREILKRIPNYGPEIRAILHDKRGRLGLAIREAIHGGDPHLLQIACDVVLEFREYDQIPVLVSAMESPSHPSVFLVAQTLVRLTEALIEECAFTREVRRHRECDVARRSASGALEASVWRFKKHGRLEAIEAFLVLATHDNSTLSRVLTDPADAAYKPIVKMLMESRQLGIIRLLLLCLEDPQCPHAVISVVARRSDPEFVNHLLLRIDAGMSTTVRQNLHRIDKLNWIEGPESLLALDPVAQRAAVRLVVSLDCERKAQLAILSKILEAGHSQGRRAVAVVLGEFNGADVDVLIKKAAADGDPAVQATALPLLRRRGISGAMQILIEALDSSDENVREVARGHLAEFDFKRYLAAFDLLKDDVRRSTGILVAKVDVTATRQLVEELRSPSRRRRIRAMQMAGILGVVPEMEDPLIEQLGESDFLMRVTAAQLLGSIPTERTKEILRRLLMDSSTAVREAAHSSLAQLQRIEREGRLLRETANDAVLLGSLANLAQLEYSPQLKEFATAD